MSNGRSACAAAALLLAGSVPLPAQDAAGAVDPAAAATIAQLEQQLTTHPFFQRITLTKVERPPFVFFVQRPPKDEALYERTIVNTYLPFLLELLDIWEREYAKPLGLPRRADAGLLAIAVLASKGSYSDYAQAVQQPGMHVMRAHYDPELRLAVTYQDSFAVGEDVRQEQRTALLHEAVHALQHACAPDGKMPPGLWWREGLADYRAGGTTTIASSLRTPKVSDLHLKLLAGVWGRKDLRALFGGLTDILGPADYNAVVQRAQQRMRGRAIDVQLVLSLFYAQSCALMEFLHEADERAHVPGLHRYLQSLYRGEAAELPAALQLELAELERRFLLHLQARLQDRFGTTLKLPDVAATPGDAAASLPPAEVDLGALAWRDDELPARLAAAHTLCADGEYELAAALLDGEGPPQLVRARERIARLPALRDELLAGAIERRRKVRFELPDGKVEGTITSVGAEGIVVRGKDEQRLPKTACSPNFLLREGRIQGRYANERWLDTFLAWLDGATMGKLASALERQEPGMEELRQDVTAPFDPEAGRPGVALARLQRAQVPDDQPAAAATLAQLRRWLPKYAADPLLDTRRIDLEEYLRALAPRAFSLDDPSCLRLHGRIEQGAGGRLRFLYEGKEDLPADCPHDKEWMRELMERMPKLATEDTRLRRLRDAYELRGSGLFRWALPLTGAQTIELTYTLDGPVVLHLWLCGDEEGNSIQVGADGTVIIVDQKENLVDSVGDPRTIWIDRKQKLRIEHDGEKLRVSVGNKKTSELARTGSRTRGHLGFLMHGSHPVKIHSLTIEGRIDPDGTEALREQFVQRTLREILPE